jgi:hypothetical protein
MATIPTQGPINLADIRDAINAAGGHATNDLMSFFSAENVAEGSPRKPISLGVDFAQDFDSTKPNYSPNFWQDGGKYGWRFDNAKVTGSQSPFLDIYNKYDGQMNGWQRALPTGGASSPYRLGDFLGYISDAEPLARNFHVTARIGSSGSFTDYVNPTEIWINDIADKPLALFLFNVETPEENSPSVELAEIEGIKDCYFGVIIGNTYGGVNKRFTASNTIAQGDTSVAINIADLGVGLYTAVPFISNKPISADVSDLNISGGITSVVVHTLPNVAPVNLRILYQEPEDGGLEFVSASATLERRSGSDYITYAVTIKNNNIITQEIYDATLDIAYTATGDVYRTLYIPSFEIGAGSQYTQTATEDLGGYLPTPPDGFTAKMYLSTYLDVVEIPIMDRRNV